ncbi:circularly permutated Ras protein 1-like isoform X2 [Engraulis encrasicolus]
MSGRRLSSPSKSVEQQQQDDEEYCTILPAPQTTLTPGLSPNNNRAPPLSAPPLPPRPAFLSLPFPEYTIVFPSEPPSPSPSLVSPSSSSSPSSLLSSNTDHALTTRPDSSPPSGPVEKQPLLGNPNVILIDLDTIVSRPSGRLMEGEPTACDACGSVLDTCYDNVVASCYFCQSWVKSSGADPTHPQPCSSSAPYQDTHFLLTPDQPAEALHTLIVFCIDISGSMSISSRVEETDRPVWKTRLEFVQEAVLQCVQSLSQTEPSARVALVTFNNEVTLHGHGEVASWRICGEELKDAEFLKNAGLNFEVPPPVSETKDYLQQAIYSLEEGGATALGPAAVVAIGMASQLPGSKVLICTDGRANTDLGDLEAEDKDSCISVSSTIFYRDLGEYAANRGVTVSVMSLEGTDCRLDELGRLADFTGGEVFISSPDKLYSAFQGMIESRTKATHCSVTLLLPTTMCLKGERETGNRAVRMVGNIMPHTELTLQYGVREQRENSQILLSAGGVSLQLQVKYRTRDGLSMLRVITAYRDVTSNSCQVLSSLSLCVLQLNSIQSSAALAVRGRLRDAQKEKETQAQLIQQAADYQQSSLYELVCTEWTKASDPLFNMYKYTRGNPVLTSVNSKPLTDKGAALLFGMKHGNRMSISRRSVAKPSLMTSDPGSQTA